MEEEAAIFGAHEGLLASGKELLHLMYEKGFRLLQNEGWADPGEWIGQTSPAYNIPLVGAILEGREPGDRRGIRLGAELGQRAADDARDSEENLLEKQFRKVHNCSAGHVPDVIEMNEMEWYEMEWNGMEWNGMEWNGMELNGMV